MNTKCCYVLLFTAHYQSIIGCLFAALVSFTMYLMYVHDKFHETHGYLPLEIVSSHNISYNLRWL